MYNIQKCEWNMFKIVNVFKLRIREMKSMEEKKFSNFEVIEVNTKR